MEGAPLIAALREIVSWVPHTRTLNSLTRMEHFLAYVQKIQYGEFFRYQGMSTQKRLEYVSVIHELSITLAGKSVLDLGPGYGDSLDVCHESGAKVIDFVEIDPFFYTYNRLKGFGRAYRLNLLWQLNRLDPGKYDLIWVKGSFCADNFIKWKVFISLTRWLRQIERIASGSSTIVICPHWRNNGIKRQVHDCRNNGFTKTMIMAGFTALRYIPHHNREPEYPITFIKHMSCDTARK